MPTKSLNNEELKELCQKTICKKFLTEESKKKDNIIICAEKFGELKHTWKVFLAGPIQGAPEWQLNMPNIEGVTWLSPRRRKYPVENFNYDEQVEWETKGLRMSDVILFWIPEPAENVEGRSYGQTTRFELGENIARGKKIIIGGYKDFPGFKYFKYKAKKYKNVLGVYDNLEDCLKCLKGYIKECNSNKQTLFSSDHHFGSDRALELSKRPFCSVEDMDWTMVERWNKKVHPGDTVYYLGDFGENEYLNYLNGDIHFIFGNYERNKKSKIDDKLVTSVSEIPVEFEDYILSHEPITGEQYMAMNPKLKFCIFGHIHGRQKIKHFGIDCGVDANNYEPMSLEEVKFYRNAIEKEFYDNEVFC